MAESFELNNYLISSSLNERNIYIKVVDKISFMCYESNIDLKELRLSIELQDAFKLINKCFQNETEHTACFNISSGIMKITFNALVGGYLNIGFEIILREKLMSNDSQLTMNFHRIEQKQIHEIKSLTQKLEQMEALLGYISYAEIFMLANHQHQNSVGSKVKLNWQLNTKDMVLSGSYWSYNKINLFYQLEKLNLSSTDDMGSSFESLKISNNSVRELVLASINCITSLLGLAGFPNLFKITITNCPSLRDVENVFSSYRHKIKEITIKDCTGINNTALLTYCQTNKIKLEMT